MRILAVDPGKTTGYARFLDGEFDSNQLPMEGFLGWAEFLIESNAGLDGVDIEDVVCESFIVNAQTLRKTRGENWSLEQIGVLRWLCRKHDVRFHLQSPAMGKGFATDEKLKQIGWYHGTTGGHANDAARHLLTFLARNGKLSEAGVSLRSST